jgi:hypothetical protein
MALCDVFMTVAVARILRRAIDFQVGTPLGSGTA